MEELKVHIWHVILWEFKNNKNTTTETAKKICSVHGQGVITYCWVRNQFSKFPSGDTSWKMNPRRERLSDLNQDALKELVECNPQKSSQESVPDFNTSKSTICCHLKKNRKSEQDGHLDSS